MRLRHELGRFGSKFLSSGAPDLPSGSAGAFTLIELPVTIGLDAAGNPDEAEIIWPGGVRQRLQKPTVDKATVVIETH